MKAMKMGVLGPLMLAEGEHSYVPRARKPRQLLAFLMLNANVRVRASDCVVELWDASPPKSATSTLQTYVLHLRDTLSELSAGDRGRPLHTLNQCYRFSVNPLDVDCFQFEDLARRGSELARAGDYAAASALFTRALELWRGPALVDVRPGPLSRPYLIELEETRKYVLEQRIEADLKLNRHHELLGELDTLTKSHPTNENLHAQFMVALYRSGMRAQALAQFRKLCRTLEDSFGFEPGTRIKRLYQAVMTDHLATVGEQPRYSRF
jgi:SARP family transcriptional regulator, regulator of embCAB operon